MISILPLKVHRPCDGFDFTSKLVHMPNYSVLLLIHFMSLLLLFVPFKCHLYLQRAFLVLILSSNMNAPLLTINPLGRRSAYRPKPQQKKQPWRLQHNLVLKHIPTGSQNHGKSWKYKATPSPPYSPLLVLSDTYLTLRDSTSPSKFPCGRSSMGGGDM